MERANVLSCKVTFFIRFVLDCEFNINFAVYKIYLQMKALVSIIMGSTSDLKVMEEAAKFLNEMKIPFEMNALSAHRVPEKVVSFAKEAHTRGLKVIIAGAGGAAHLPGVIAALTPLPVIGVPIKSSNSIDGWDSILSILQMPSGIPVATVALDGARNAAILAAQILASSDIDLFAKIQQFKRELAEKITTANEELTKIHYNFKI
jgi:5-(carboxyamino)imidazole ribonucleotide mutase